jgi:hypothetical protein
MLYNKFNNFNINENKFKDVENNQKRKRYE